MCACLYIDRSTNWEKKKEGERERERVRVRERERDPVSDQFQDTSLWPASEVVERHVGEVVERHVRPSQGASIRMGLEFRVLSVQAVPHGVLVIFPDVF